jgi:xanthine dehydrogenase YagT iron-sulfur-binding subunit
MPQKGSLSDGGRDQGVTRRWVLRSGATAAVTVPLAARAAQSMPTLRAKAQGAVAEDAMDMTLTVNGQMHRMALDPRTVLLDALRERLGFTGSKKGCDHGQCGACTVHVGGKRVLSCLTLAASVREPIVTIEGLANPDGTLHPMQQAFIDQDAFQCGYCTPGQILSGIACINEGHARSDAEIREYMSGNLCRCAAYPHIVKAVVQATSPLQAQMPPKGD